MKRRTGSHCGSCESRNIERVKKWVDINEMLRKNSIPSV